MQLPTYYISSGAPQRNFPRVLEVFPMFYHVCVLIQGPHQGSILGPATCGPPGVPRPQRVRIAGPQLSATLCHWGSWWPCLSPESWLWPPQSSHARKYYGKYPADIQLVPLQTLLWTIVINIPTFHLHVWATAYCPGRQNPDAAWNRSIYINSDSFELTVRLYRLCGKATFLTGQEMGWEARAAGLKFFVSRHLFPLKEFLRISKSIGLCEFLVFTY